MQLYRKKHFHDIQTSGAGSVVCSGLAGPVASAVASHAVRGLVRSRTGEVLASFPTVSAKTRPFDHAVELKLNYMQKLIMQPVTGLRQVFLP